MRAFTKEWLKVANDDLLTIEEIIDNEHLTHIVAFHSQQCIEKLMKALIEENEIDIPKIHSLIKLKKILEKQTIWLDDNILKKLDKLYISSRYPSDMGLLPYGKPTHDDANEFYNFVLEAFEKVCKILDIELSEVKV